MFNNDYHHTPAPPTLINWTHMQMSPGSLKKLKIKTHGVAVSGFSAARFDQGDERPAMEAPVVAKMRGDKKKRRLLRL